MHIVSPPGHAVAGGWHLLSMQVCPKPHLVPHPPQLSGSSCKFLHPRHPAAPHARSPGKHAARPSAQTSLWQTVVPQPPQFFGSKRVSTHAPPHSLPAH